MRNEQEIKNKIIETLYSAGCDEAGAGCGASDLLVAAVILDPKNPIEGLNDSKKLTEKKREESQNNILIDNEIKFSSRLDNYLPYFLLHHPVIN